MFNQFKSDYFKINNLARIVLNAREGTCCFNTHKVKFCCSSKVFMPLNKFVINEAVVTCFNHAVN